MLLVFLAPALVLRRGVRYLRDFAPFALLIFAYAECRGLAHLVSPHPFYRPQLWLERALFGVVPAQWLQEELWHGTTQWYDRAAHFFLQLHFIVPPLLAFALWVKRRALFFRFASSMLVLSFASALVFLLYPAAPPWAAGRTLLIPTVTRIDDGPWSAVPNSVSLSSVIQGNPYAAIPSLHGGYAFLVFLFVASLAWPTRWRWPVAISAALYPLALSFSVVYTGNHYVVDLLLGYAFAAGAFAGTRSFWRRNGLPE